MAFRWGGTTSSHLQEGAQKHWGETAERDDISEVAGADYKGPFMSHQGS